MTRDDYLIAIHGARKGLVAYGFRRGLSVVEAEMAVDSALRHIEAHLDVTMVSYRPLAAVITATERAASNIIRRRAYAEQVSAATHVWSQRRRDDIETLRCDVRAAFATLPAVMQWAAWKVVVEGNTWDHVAQQLEVHPHALKAQVRRALHSLRPRLAAYAPCRANVSPASSHERVERRRRETVEKCFIPVG